MNIRKLSNFKFFWWFTLVNVGVVGLLAITSQGTALPLSIFVIIFGSAGSVFSLFFSRWLAMKTLSIVKIDDKENHEFVWLVDDVRELCYKARLKAMPQVGIWPGPDANALATGSRA